MTAPLAPAQPASEPRRERFGREMPERVVRELRARAHQPLDLLRGGAHPRDPLALAAGAAFRGGRLDRASDAATRPASSRSGSAMSLRPSSSRSSTWLCARIAATQARIAAARLSSPPCRRRYCSSCASSWNARIARPPAVDASGDVWPRRGAAWISRQPSALAVRTPYQPMRQVEHDRLAGRAGQSPHDRLGRRLQREAPQQRVRQLLRAEAELISLPGRVACGVARLLERREHAMRCAQRHGESARQLSDAGRSADAQQCEHVEDLADGRVGGRSAGVGADGCSAG